MQEQATDTGGVDREERQPKPPERRELAEDSPDAIVQEAQECIVAADEASMKFKKALDVPEQSLNEIQKKLKGRVIIPMEDVALANAQAEFERLQNQFSALQEEEAYWKSQLDDAVRVFGTYPKDYKGRFLQSGFVTNPFLRDTSVKLSQKQATVIEMRQKKLQEVRQKMGELGQELACRDLALTRIESDCAMKDDPERGHRLLLEAWERYGASIKEYDSKMWDELPASVRALGESKKLSRFEAEFYQHLIDEHFGDKIATEVQNARQAIRKEHSLPPPSSAPPSFSDFLKRQASYRPPDPNALRHQVPHLDLALAIALEEQRAVNDLTDLVDQARDSEGVRLSEYREPTWGIENKPIASEGTLKNIITPAGEIKGVLMTQNAEHAFQSCPQGMRITLTKTPFPIELKEPQKKSFREAGLGGLLGLDKTGWRIVRYDTLNADNIRFVSVKDDTVSVRRTDSAVNDVRTTVPDIDRERDERAMNVVRCLDRDPRLLRIQNAARDLREGCAVIQALFGPGLDGNKYQSFVDFTRGKALDMRRILSDASMQTDTRALKNLLAQLKTSNIGLAHGGLEASVGAHIHALEGFLNMLESGQLRNVINTMIDKSQWDADTWLNWAKKDLPVIVAQIAGAVIAITAVTMLAPICAPVWMLAAQGIAGAGGAAIGGGVAKDMIHAGYNMLDADVQRGEAVFTERSRPVAYLADDKTFDAESDAMRSRELWRDTASPMAAEFIQNALISMATMGVSKVAADKISRFLTNPKVVAALSKRSALLQGMLDRLSKTQHAKLFWQKVAGEIPEEFAEEAAEPVVDHVLGAIHPLLGSTGSVIVGIVNGVHIAKPGTMGHFRSECAQKGFLVSDVTIDGKQGCRVMSADGREQWTMREADSVEMERAGQEVEVDSTETTEAPSTFSPDVLTELHAEPAKSAELMSAQNRSLYYIVALDGVETLVRARVTQIEQSDAGWIFTLECVKPDGVSFTMQRNQQGENANGFPLVDGVRLPFQDKVEAYLREHEISFPALHDSDATAAADSNAPTKEEQELRRQEVATRTERIHDMLPPIPPGHTRMFRSIKGEYVSKIPLTHDEQAELANFRRQLHDGTFPQDQSERFSELHFRNTPDMGGDDLYHLVQTYDAGSPVTTLLYADVDLSQRPDITVEQRGPMTGNFYVPPVGSVEWKAVPKNAQTEAMTLAQKSREAFAKLPSDATDAQHKECIRELKEYLTQHDIDDSTRISLAETLLNRNRPLTEPERTALLAAHEVGKGETGKDGMPAGIDNYTTGQLRAKTEKLAEAFINPEERRLLIEAGLAGKPSPSPVPLAKPVAMQKSPESTKPKTQYKPGDTIILYKDIPGFRETIKGLPGGTPYRLVEVDGELYLVGSDQKGHYINLRDLPPKPEPPPPPRPRAKAESAEQHGKIALDRGSPEVAGRINDLNTGFSDFCRKFSLEVTDDVTADIVYRCPMDIAEKKLREIMEKKEKDAATIQTAVATLRSLRNKFERLELDWNVSGKDSSGGFDVLKSEVQRLGPRPTPQHRNMVPNPGALQLAKLKPGEKKYGWVCKQLSESAQISPQLVTIGRDSKTGEMYFAAIVHGGLAHQRFPLTHRTQESLAPVTDLHREAVERQEPASGWKFHLNFDAENFSVRARVASVMNQLERDGLIADYKIGHRGGKRAGAPGKEATVYVGDGKKAHVVAAYIDRELADILLPPEGDTLTDDRTFVGNVRGRFDIDDRRDPQFDRYGSDGISYTVRDSQRFHGHRPRDQQSIDRSDKILRERYGIFYSGAFGEP